LAALLRIGDYLRFLLNDTMPIDYQIFDLAGPHYELGRAQGARTERFGIPAWWPAPPGNACAVATKSANPFTGPSLRGPAP